MQRYTFYIITLLFSMLALAAPSSTRQLTGPSIKNGSAIITLPTTTGTICGISESCVLTNKTISGLSNTISNIGLTTQVTGVLPIANGGTNNGSLAVTAGGTLYTDGSKLVNVGAGSSGQVLKSNGASAPTWGNAQGGLISDREMITNTDIEVDASGYTAYADSGSIPTDCTGGSPNSAIARSTTTPITGTGELLWTKSGSASRQGEGFSIPFTIGTADQAKVMQLDIDSIVRSGTFVAGSSGVDSDLEFYIYSVSDSQLIQPTTYKVFSNSSSGAFHTTTNFQTTASGTSYRLCIHTATTSTANYTVGFDNISIHPSRYTYGTPITDWVSWTPTGSWTANTTYTGFKRRVGNSGEYDVKVATSAAPTSATLTVNMPSGEVIDTAKWATGTGDRHLGGGSVLDASVALYPVFTDYSSTTAVIPTLENAAGTNLGAGTAITQAVPMAFGAGDYVHVHWSAPIVGFQSTVQMSDSAPQTRISFSGSQSSQAVTANTTNVAFTASVDRGGNWNGTQFVVPAPGDYVVSGNAIVSAAATLQVYKNGSLALNGSFSTTGGGSSQSAGSVLVAGCVAGDLLSLRSANSVTLTNGNIGIYLLSSNQTIGATETTAFSADRSSNQTGINMNNGTIKIVLNRAVDDTSGMVNTSTGTATLSKPGRYACNGAIDYSNTNILASTYYGAQIVAGGTTYSGPLVIWGATTFTTAQVVTPEMSLKGGDTIELYARSTGNQSSSTLTAQATNTRLSCWRIGL